jgi:hypothetical protein
VSPPAATEPPVPEASLPLLAVDPEPVLPPALFVPLEPPATVVPLALLASEGLSPPPPPHPANNNSATNAVDHGLPPPGRDEPIDTFII